MGFMLRLEKTMSELVSSLLVISMGLLFWFFRVFLEWLRFRLGFWIFIKKANLSKFEDLPKLLSLV